MVYNAKKVQVLGRKEEMREEIIYIGFYDFDYNVIFLVMFWLDKY